MVSNIISIFFISLTHYSIRSAYPSIENGRGYLLGWTFKGSTDGKNLELIENVEYTEELINYNVSVRPVDQRFSNIPFRHFKYSMTRVNHDTYSVMRISNLDFFGEIRTFYKINTYVCNKYLLKLNIIIITLVIS